MVCAPLPPGTEVPKCWWAKLSTIAGNGYALAAGRYKPQVAELAPEGDPVELIEQTLKLERAIAADLERLLKDVAKS